MRLQLLEIVAGRQRRPVAGEDDDARRAIGLDRREGVDQRFDHRQAQRVARRRRLQGQGRDAAPVLAAQQSERVFTALRGGHAGAPPAKLQPYALAAARTIFAHAIASDSASWWLSAIRSFAQTSESLVGRIFQARREICTVQRNGSDGARRHSARSRRARRSCRRGRCARRKTPRRRASVRASATGPEIVGIRHVFPPQPVDMGEHEFSRRRPDQVNGLVDDFAADHLHQPDRAGAVGLIIRGLEVYRDKIHRPFPRTARDRLRALRRHSVTRRRRAGPLRCGAAAK